MHRSQADPICRERPFPMGSVLRVLTSGWVGAPRQCRCYRRAACLRCCGGWLPHGCQRGTTNQLLSVSPTLSDLNTMLALNSWEKIMNIHPRLSVPGYMGLSGFAHPLGSWEPQTEGSDQAQGEAAQTRMRRCCHSLVALGDNQKTTGPKLAKKKKKSQEFLSN